MAHKATSHENEGFPCDLSNHQAGVRSRATSVALEYYRNSWQILSPFSKQSILIVAQYLENPDPDFHIIGKWNSVLMDLLFTLLLRSELEPQRPTTRRIRCRSTPTSRSTARSMSRPPSRACFPPLSGSRAIQLLLFLEKMITDLLLLSDSFLSVCLCCLALILMSPSHCIPMFKPFSCYWSRY